MTTAHVETGASTEARVWTPGWIAALAVLSGVAVAAVSVLATLLVAAPRLPDDGSVEVGFVRDMTTHHEQAVTMAEAVRGRAANPTVGQVAREIALVQQAQIGQMGGWRDVWGVSPNRSGPAMAWMGMPTEGRMPGMASPEDLARLGTATGADVDARFLRLMIEHHRAGVDMAQAVLQRTDQPEVVRLAEQVVLAQEGEIATMQALLDEIPGAERSAPADEAMEGMDHGGRR